MVLIRCLMVQVARAGGHLVLMLIQLIMTTKSTTKVPLLLYLLLLYCTHFRVLTRAGIARQPGRKKQRAAPPGGNGGGPGLFARAGLGLAGGWPSHLTLIQGGWLHLQGAKLEFGGHDFFKILPLTSK